MSAVSSGSYDALIELLTDDVTLWADGGGSVRGAATRPLHGHDAVARFVLSSTRFLPDGAAPEIAEVNGEPAAILRVGENAVFVIAIAARDDRIAEIRVSCHIPRGCVVSVERGGTTHAVRHSAHGSPPCDDPRRRA